MTDTQGLGDLSAKIAKELPFLRRYARALTGSQTTGDNYAAAALETILEDNSVFDPGLSPRVALFKVFNDIWSSSGAPVEKPEEGGLAEERAQSRLASLTPNTREALLLHVIEGFEVGSVATIMGISAAEAQELVDIARAEMRDSIQGSVMVIEDEAIIAMDITSIVEQAGHEVTGVARTRDEAVRLADATLPDLVLADIQLADKSSGIDAANQIIENLGEVPIIFITAFPERLLTGERPEPAFLITKPFTVEQVHSAISQAMFFSSTETLQA